MKTLVLLIGFAIANLSICFAQSKTSRSLEERISSHYTASELAEIKTRTPYKLDVLLFYYQESFLIKEADGSLRKASPAEVEAIDIDSYQHLRNESVRVEVQVEDLNTTILLLSATECKDLAGPLVPAHVIDPADPQTKSN